ncbi:CGNR zinc finger domain-containing protein [Streptacidiphilus anmyonensis]|uniref:CGNR zinc finger domain-containing protein n=1 Tax=Streptacidiphilus anmyonensis TaxID=405782 RepID=UPI0005A6D62C|nr:CGNR zinc finger domain-containing protein [Streptacidiphilus anmyonensis]
MDPEPVGGRPLGLYFLVDLVNAFQGGAEVTTAGLQSLAERHGGQALRLADARVPELREAAALLGAVLDSDDVDRAAEAVNALLDRYPSQPRLVRLPDRPWAVHARTPQDAGPVHWLLSTAALALALWLAERGRCAWGRCAAPDCDRYFVDTGRRSPQRYCSPRCGTRVRVTAHRRQHGR